MIEDIVLTNSQQRKSIKINKENGPYYLEQLEIGGVQGEHKTHKFPGQIGESVDSVTLGTRPVTIIGWCVDSSELPLSRAKQILNKMIDPMQELSIETAGGYVLKFFSDESIAYAKSKKDNNDLICKFMISGEAYSSLWRSKNAVESLVSYVDGNFILPMGIPESGFVFGVINPASATKIANEGLPTGCIITITALGQVINPKLTCSETQESFEILKTLAKGETIVVDTIPGERGIKGYLDGVEYNYLDYIAEDSSWISLPSGVSTFFFSALEGKDFLNISIAFNTGFLEVEE